MAFITYIDAISKGLWEEMERDPTVVLLGEDIGDFGGAFKVTKGFLNHFGPDRVIDTVLAETAIVGAATGAAVVGIDQEIGGLAVVHQPFVEGPDQVGSV